MTLRCKKGKEMCSGPKLLKMRVGSQSWIALAGVCYVFFLFLFSLVSVPGGEWNIKGSFPFSTRPGA